MSNPWLKKNPFMSMWLSAANSAAGSARGQIAASAKRQSQAAITQATQDVMSFWTGALTGHPKPPARRKTKR
ncbi:hypothetical protein J2X20_002289 [Pelomonas saccharophila]|uniref:Uncharacterized protein n=1 Tax=Roseateles saccharophilus TaxID=304 RepID=A0ABU1YN46_ROSSA|nr:hypothetical protein [Roseateles saccharophilus]MDR7269660.1 hypothetical protein [Roseateles saccharophilus]